MTPTLDQHLRGTSIFAGLPDKDIAKVLAAAKERRFAAGQQIIRQGDKGAVGFFLIVEGRAEVLAGDAALAELGPGDYFGEMALLLEDTTRTADVVALEDTTCLVITQWAFKALLAAHPDVAGNVMAELARRLRDTSRALSE